MCRRQFQGDVIAITGSTGKTTVKEMIAAILNESGRVLYTKGNYNNHIGAPLTLSRLDNTYDYAVVELGANHAGEILYNSQIVKPSIAIINNISEAHIAEFGDLDTIIKTKSEIFEKMDNGIAIINADNQSILEQITNGISALKVRTFSQNTGDIKASNIQPKRDFTNFTAITPKGNIAVHLPLPGTHNVTNALGAISATIDLVSISAIQSGLKKMSPIPGRLVKLTGINSSCIIDDTYNAAPNAVIASLNYFSTLPGKKWFIFGDMGELGTHSDMHHKNMGLLAKKLGIDEVHTVGKFSNLTSKAFGINGHHYNSQSELINHIAPALQSDISILIKGSRFTKMENVVQSLVKQA